MVPGSCLCSPPSLKNLADLNKSWARSLTQLNSARTWYRYKCHAIRFSTNNSVYEIRKNHLFGQHHFIIKYILIWFKFEILEMITFTLQSRNSELKLTKTYSVSHVCVVAVHLKKSYYVCVRDACMHTKSCKGNILRMLSRLAWELKSFWKEYSYFLLFNGFTGFWNMSLLKINNYNFVIEGIV